MESYIRGVKKNQKTLRAAQVLLAICLQGALTYSCSVLSSSFYVTHLVNRGIPKIHVGLIGMMPAAGFLLNGFYDFLDYLLHTKQFSLRSVQLSTMAAIIVNCAAQGVVEYLPTDQNLLLTILMILFRAIHGFLGFLCGKGTVQCCQAWFPDYLNFTVGLEMSMNYLGGGLCVLMSGFIYSALGFNEPYFVVSFICAIFWLYNFFFMPRSSDPVYIRAETEENKDTDALQSPQSKFPDMEAIETKSTDEEDSNKKGLTWMLVFPLSATALVTLLEGYTAAITTPYFHDKFGMNVDEGWSYLFILFLSLVIGAVGVGFILQMGWLSSYRAMIAGGCSSTIGLLLTFPDERMIRLYTAVPKSAYAGNFLIGLGSISIAIASLPALEETHVSVTWQRFTRKGRSQAASLWMIFWMLAVYVGHLVALLVMEFLSYSQGGWLMVGCSVFSIAFNVVMDIITNRCRSVKKHSSYL
ncbi:hypothetical protein ACHWQZ_G018472 [Mnemiopsis leidyi]